MFVRQAPDLGYSLEFDYIPPEHRADPTPLGVNEVIRSIRVIAGDEDSFVIESTRGPKFNYQSTAEPTIVEEVRTELQVFRECAEVVAEVARRRG